MPRKNVTLSCPTGYLIRPTVSEGGTKDRWEAVHIRTEATGPLRKSENSAVADAIRMKANKQ